MILQANAFSSSIANQSYLAKPIKLPADKNAYKLLAQDSSTTRSIAQSIQLGEIHGKIFELLTDQPLLNAHVVIVKSGEEHKRFQTESGKSGTSMAMK